MEASSGQLLIKPQGTSGLGAPAHLVIFSWLWNGSLHWDDEDSKAILSFPNPATADMAKEQKKACLHEVTHTESEKA